MIQTAVQAVLFDLDGTLVDSAPDLALAVDRMLRDLGQESVGEERVREWVGNGARRLVERALTGRLDGRLEADQLEPALEIFFGHYADCLVESTCAYPGVTEALEQLHLRGLPLAVVTNKPARFTMPLLAHLGLRRYFHAVVSGDTLPHRKPDPGPLLLAAEQCGVAPGAALMVGDSDNDVRAARAAGMPVACVPYGYNHGDDIAAAGPDLILESLLALPGALEQAA